MNLDAGKPVRPRNTRAASWIALIVLVNICPPAAGTEKFAAQTGKPCAQCHNYPAGDLKLTPFGRAFVANGYKLPPERSSAPVQDSKPPASSASPPK